MNANLSTATRASRWRRSMHVGSLALLVVLIVALVAHPQSHTTPYRHVAPGVSWPLRIAAHTISYLPEYQKPLPYATVITRAQLDRFNGPTSVHSEYGVMSALGVVDGAQYALVSSDHGATWRTLGGWLYLAGAGMSAWGTNTLVRLGPHTFASYMSHGSVCDITFDSGHHWRQSMFQGAFVLAPQRTVPAVDFGFKHERYELEVIVSRHHRHYRAGYFISFTDQSWRLLDR